MTSIPLLTRLALRRDCGRLLAWALGVCVFSLICALHVSTGFPDEAARADALRVALDSPVLIVGRGLPMGASHGAFLLYTYGVVISTGLALFAVLFAARHGRAEEDDGTRELVRAAATDGRAVLASVFAAGGLSVAVLAAAAAVGFTVGGAAPVGSLLAGLVFLLIGLVFLAVGVLAGQLAPSARAATGLGAVAILMMFAVRTISDLGADTDPVSLVSAPAALGWFSPFSLLGIAAPFGALDARPLLVLAVAASVLAAVSAVLERGREFGGSLLPDRPGPATARPSLRTPFRLVLRLHRGTLSAMLVAGAAVGAFAAALTGLAGSGENSAVGELVRDLVGDEGPVRDLLLGYVMVLVGECAAIAGALVALRARREETTAGVEAVRAAAVGPGRWYCSVVGVGALSVVIVLAAAALGASGIGLAQGAGPADAWSMGAAAFAQLPAALLCLGIAVLVLGAAPRFAAPVTWTFLALSVVLAELGPRLGLPSWAIALSPFLHGPTVGGSGIHWGGSPWLLAIAAICAAAGWSSYRRRDLAP